MTQRLDRVVALGLVTAAVRRTPASRLEARIVHAVTSSRPPCTVAAATATTRLGCRPVALVAAGLADAITAKRRHDAPVPSALLLVTAGLAARALLCHVIARPRPPADGWLAKPHGFSYPSRHTTAAALGFGALARSVPAEYQPAARLAATVVIGAVATSRVYLGVHWTTDVLGGWLFASLWLSLPRGAGKGPSTSTRRRRRPG